MENEEGTKTVLFDLAICTVTQIVCRSQLFVQLKNYNFLFFWLQVLHC